MENNDSSTSNDKKAMNRGKSQSTPPLKIKNEPSKRKSFNVNEAVRSLDMALGRLKKSKLVNGDYPAGRPMRAAAHGATDMFMDISPSSNLVHGIDNASLMSMNFSHYELVRNLSRSNCNSDCGGGTFSGTTRSTPADLNVKDEHLERYFRSIEMWSRNFREGSPSRLRVEMPEE